MLPLTPRNELSCKYPRVAPANCVSPRLNRRKVSRCLFGKLDPGQMRSWFNEKFQEYEHKAQTKWDFDFALDTPICQEGPSQNWSWVPVGNDTCPKFYHQKTLAPCVKKPARSVSNVPISSPENVVPPVFEGASCMDECQFRPILLPSTPAEKRSTSSTANPEIVVLRKNLRLPTASQIHKPQPAKISDVFASRKRGANGGVSKSSKVPRIDGHSSLKLSPSLP